jgi:membrane-associated phospholipid phosphatase
MKIRSIAYPFDWIIVGYSSLMLLLILLLGRPISAYVDEIVFYASVTGLVALVIRYVDERRGRAWALVRLLYPLLLFTFFYRTTGGLMFLVFDGFYDWQLTTFEKMILGVNPTLYIDRHLLNTWVNEILSFSYFSYYLMLPGFLLPVFFKRDYVVVREVLTAVCLAFFASYLLFFLYPIEGPRFHFADEFVNTVEGPVFRPLVEFVIANGAVRGGCMPSSHVAVALVILIYGMRYYPTAGRLLLPLNIGLAVGTVWGRYHYVSDVVVGAGIGVFMVLLVRKYFGNRRKRSYGPAEKRQREKEHVS